jgi:hypothetical protein
MCTKHYTRWIRYGDPHKVIVKRGEAAAMFKQLLVWSEKEECVDWPFSRSGSDSRPWIKWERKGGLVARHLCFALQGNPPSKNSHAAHKCGNKDCVNPHHIYWASPKQNQADRVTHGTSPRGEAQGASKLTEGDVRRIRSLEGEISSNELAKEYAVEGRQIRRIWRRERWAWLT